jgi:hypothetical protein
VVGKGVFGVKCEFVLGIDTEGLRNSGPVLLDALAFLE